MSPQFSGPLSPRPPETTTSASAMVGFPSLCSILAWVHLAVVCISDVQL